MTRQSGPEDGPADGEPLGEELGLVLGQALGPTQRHALLPSFMFCTGGDDLAHKVASSGPEASQVLPGHWSYYDLGYLFSGSNSDCRHYEFVGT